MPYILSDPRLYCRAIAAAMLLAAVPIAMADDVSPALDRVSLWLGGYSLDTEIALDARNTAGNVSTGKVNLDSGNETVGRARLDFLFLDSQGFTLDYYTLDRASTQVLNKPFTYAGLPFQLDSTLHGKIDLAAGSVSYHWWFGSDTDVIGVGLGGTYYRLKVGIAGTVALNDISVQGSATWQDDAIAPLITVAYKHAFSNSLRVYADASGVRKNGGKLAGHIDDGRVGIEWFPWQNFGLSAEYGVTHIHLDHDGESYIADLNVKFSGPSLFARVRF